MRYLDARCNAIADGSDALVAAFTDIRCNPWDAKHFMLGEALRRASYRWGDRRPHLKLSWVRMKNVLDCAEKR